MVRSPTRLILVLSLGAAAGVGMARFGFGPVLPAMSADLGWSLPTAGAVQSANLAAYLVGSVLTPRITARYGLDRPFLVAFLAVGGTLVLSGSATLLVSHLALRVIAGFAAAVLWIGGGMIAARVATDATSGLIIGVFFAGLGTGLVATGLLLPVAFQTPDGWRVVWWVMGAIVLAAAPMVRQAVRTTARMIAANAPRPSFFSFSALFLSGRTLLRLEIAYALFGLGSIGYMTFVVAYLRDNDASPAAIGVFWVALGVSIWLGGKLWANSISKSRSGRLAGLMYLMMAVASSIVLTSTTATALLASGAAFGSVFVAVVAATTHLIRLHVAQEFWTVTLAGFTVWFGVGLTVGSAATGIISDSYGLSAGILVSVITLAAAAVVAALQSAPTELET